MLLTPLVRCRGRILLGCLLACVTAFAAQADPVRTTLAGDYADFALHPGTGDVVAVEPVGNQVHLYRRAALSGRQAEPTGTIDVGVTPVSIFFKQYKDKAYYAVVCSQQSRMFLIDAERFELVEQIELSGPGVSQVTGSLNPDDPFVYYNFGSGHDSEAGVVNLRTMTNQGIAFNDSMDCAISADGQFAYRRGPWSPSGFDSLALNNTFDDDKPQFVRHVDEHRSTPAYFPDPLGRYTFTGNNVYDRTLSRSVGQLPFVGETACMDQPIILGHDPINTRNRGGQSLKIHAASYNTFKPIGQPQEFALPQFDAEEALPRGVQGQADFKRVSRRDRLFSDDRRDAVIFAYRTQVVVIPRADFMLPSEPFLAGDLLAPELLSVGQTYRMPLKLQDLGVKVSFDVMPAGMEVDGLDLVWTPGPDDVGPTTVVAKISHGNSEQIMRYQLSVAYDHIPLPFEATGMTVNDAGTLALVWNGTENDPRRRQENANDAPTVDLALIDLESGEVRAQRTLATPVGNATIIGNRVVLYQQNRSPTCDVLSTDDLERKSALLTEGNIITVAALGKHMVIRTHTSVEVYDPESLERIKLFGGGSRLQVQNIPSEVDLVTPHGMLINYVLLDETLAPKLLLNVSGLPTLPSDNNQPSRVTIPPQLQTTSQLDQNLRPDRRIRNAQSLTWKPVPRGDAAVDVTRTVEQQPAAQENGRPTHRYRILVGYTTANGRQSQTLSVTNIVTNQNNANPVLAALADRAIVLHERAIYRWSYPQVQPVDVAQNPKLDWTPRQSHLTLDKGEATVLEHPVTGGKPPLRFTLMTRYAGAEINPQTGKVTLDNAAIQERALNFAAQQAARISGQSVNQKVGLLKQQIDETMVRTLGERHEQITVALPVVVEVSDAELKTQVIQYQVLVSVPLQDTAQALQAMVDQQQAARQEREGIAPGVAPGGAPAGPPLPVGVEQEGEIPFVEDQVEQAHGEPNARQLEQRIESLEQQIELLTRQLNLLMRELERQQPRDRQLREIEKDDVGDAGDAGDAGE